MDRAERARRRLVRDAIAWLATDRAAAEAFTAREADGGLIATSGLAERRAQDRLRTSIQAAIAEGVAE